MTFLTRSDHPPEGKRHVAGRPPRRAPSRAVACLLSVLVAGPVAGSAARAQEVVEAPRDRGVLTLLNENDMWGGTDRYYTNGLRLGWTSPVGPPPAPLSWLDRQFDWMLGDGAFRWSLSLDQAIFTPEDIRNPRPDPRDRPYAGHLSLTLGLERATERERTVLAFQLGMVGPAAGGEFIQNRWHDVINKYHAEGWDAQLRDEPTFGVMAERNWRVSTGRLGAFDTEIIPAATLALGTAHTYAGGGITFRLGDALDADWGPSRLRPSLGDSAPGKLSRDFGWYVFGGIGGRGVARNLFLDGSTWRDSASVDRRPLVGEIEAGLAIFWRGMRLAYTQVWQSKEFSEQKGGQSFGAISLTIPF